MDSLHQAHLERILENRRRRGVLATQTSRYSASTATQTRELEGLEKVSASPMKSDLSPNPRGMSDCAMADDAARLVGFLRVAQDAAEGSFNDGLGNMGKGNRHGARFTEDGNRLGRNTPLAYRYSSRRDNYRFGNFGGDSRETTSTSRRGQRPYRKSPSLVARSTSIGRNNNAFSSSMTPRRTVPLLTYSCSDGSVFSTSRGREGSLYVWRRTPLRSNYTQFSRRDSISRPYERRDISRSDYASGMSSHKLSGAPSRNGAGNTFTSRHQSSVRRPDRSEGTETLHRFPNERERQAAGSVIYAVKEDSAGPPHRPQVPDPLPSQVASHSNFERKASRNPRGDVVGLPVPRTTMDLRTSVSILASGDWFYKWNTRGTSVSPRWVWLGTQSHVLLWSHKETYESAFAGTIKLEKIHQVAFRELQQPGDDGIPQIYYVLLVETGNRVLQLATERRAKADVWYEALNNVLLHLKSHGFDAVDVSSP